MKYIEVYRNGELIGYINQNLKVKAESKENKKLIENLLISPIKLYKASIENEISISYTEIVETNNKDWIYNRIYDLPKGFEISNVKEGVLSG